MPKYLNPTFSALADPTRRAVIEALSQGPASVSTLAAPFEMSLPAFVQHLAVLEDSGLIQTRKEGRVRTCYLKSEALEALNTWVADALKYWEDRLDALANYAESLHQATKPLVNIEGSGDIRRINLQLTLAAPIKKVWSALTQPEQIRHWWPDWHPSGILEPREGGRIAIGDGGWLDGRIKVWAPPYILAFSWREEELDAPWFEPATKSLLHLQLLESDNATQLTLQQYAPLGSVAGGAAGWHNFAATRLPIWVEEDRVDEQPERFNELHTLYRNMLTNDSSDQQQKRDDQKEDK